MSVLLEALVFASKKHRHQRRKDREASPYINHPIMLANILWNEAEIRDLTAVAASILHDTVEDTETTLQEIELAFGPRVASVVAEVTDDKTLPKQARKQLQVLHAASASDQAKLVKIADKIANLRDLATSPPPSWSSERVSAYFEWSKAVIDALRGNHPRLEALFDEAYANGTREQSETR
ncbi:MAG: bifunctional (p)ppGpp synthetase/guanosine-3',5'-bis(diphosphate) 3'-pyrophosphohydrolase [Deltaproteobacteria bacterium]|nr:bifunctional (p)ppGpp synthetase/guanosine-3',5'-bis(diphosphate) 3'-pyrophosphohydrolase [Deltaproteobacteria bacterium]